MPHCATETPVSSSLVGCELAFRAIVAFEHALDPVARSHAWTHTHTHTYIRVHRLFWPLVPRHAPFKTSNTLLAKVFGRVLVYGPHRPFLGHSAKEIRSASHLFHQRKLWVSGSNSTSCYCISKGIPSFSLHYVRCGCTSQYVAVVSRCFMGSLEDTLLDCFCFYWKEFRGVKVCSFSCFETVVVCRSCASFSMEYFHQLNPIFVEGGAKARFFTFLHVLKLNNAMTFESRSLFPRKCIWHATYAQYNKDRSVNREISGFPRRIDKHRNEMRG